LDCAKYTKLVELTEGSVVVLCVRVYVRACACVCVCDTAGALVSSSAEECACPTFPGTVCIYLTLLL
jgi:hypothetical protein